ncbi:MAG: ABC transporter permease [Turicibacter sp.]|nr:ABC transporter permease [Turicibacter sp.]
MVYIRKYIIRRLLQLIPILIGITLLSFALMQSSKTDVVDLLYQNSGNVASQEVKEEMRKELGLDKPFLVQYATWLGNILKGDMGMSYVMKKPVFTEFMKRLPNTIVLTISSILVTFVVSVPLGILSAVKQNKFTDYIIRFFSFIGNSLPGFFLSLILIYVFSLKLDLLPVMGNNGLKSLVLPTLTLAISMSAKYTRQIRATVLEELNKEYVLGLRSRGIKEQRILYVNILKVALLTVVTLLGLSIGSLLGGTAIVESIFMWDGVGKLAVDAIKMMDYPIIQAYVIWMAVIFVVINLITDILYNYLDPRIRIGKDIW